QSLLNDAGRLQAATKTFVHHPVVERRAWPSWEPNKRCIREVSQAESLLRCERVPFRYGQLDTLNGDQKLVQLRIGLWHAVDEPRIQTTGPYSSICFTLADGRRSSSASGCSSR